jgi:hypothetical protein
MTHTAIVPHSDPIISLHDLPKIPSWEKENWQIKYLYWGQYLEWCSCKSVRSHLAFPCVTSWRLLTRLIVFLTKNEANTQPLFPAFTLN